MLLSQRLVLVPSNHPPISPLLTNPLPTNPLPTNPLPISPPPIPRPTPPQLAVRLPCLVP
jgi:hypothetical protein